MAAVTDYFRKNPFWLVLTIFAITVGTFVGEPLLRSTGDEKVYVAQAIEMAASGSWFLQTLAEVPDYYKGPLFYILLRIGFEIFGATAMWATLYMNVIGVAIALWCLDKLIRDSLPAPSSEGAPDLDADEAAALAAAHTFSQWQMRAFGGVMLITSAGLLSHFFSAQMECLSICFYIVVAYLAQRVVERDARMWSYLMWITIGVAGWLKSPVYSVLLGVSAILYIAFCGQVFKKIFSVDGALSVLVGVAVGLGGYMPALMLDGENFYRTYIARESLGKSGGNGVPWWDALVPVFTVHLLPWTPLWLFALVGYIRSTNLGELVSIRDYNPAFKLAIAFAGPLLAFFTFHPFRSEIYALPALPFIILVLVAIIPRIRPMLERNWTWLMTVSLVLVLLPVLVVLALYFRLGMTTAWPMSVMSWQLALLGYCVVAFVALLWAGKRSWVPLVFVGLSVLMLWFTQSIGAIEFGGLKKLIDRRPNANILYLNVDRFLWSEWGYLSMWVDHPVTGVHSWDQLVTKMPTVGQAADSLPEGSSAADSPATDSSSADSLTTTSPVMVICQNDDQVTELKSRLQQFDPAATFEVENWPRFKVHGKDADSGQSILSVAWQQGDMAALFKPMPVVTVTRFEPGSDE